MTASTSEPEAIAWIESEVHTHHGKDAELPVSNNNLCEFLRDGRALILLIGTLAPNCEESLAIPKKIEKSMRQLSTFHALERIHFFIRWCRSAAKLEEHLIFTSVQLLDETNVDAVLATIDGLRQRFRPTTVVKQSTPSPTPTPVDDEGDNNATNDSTTLSEPFVPTTNKLNAFLTKVSSTPTPAPTIERQTSLSKRASTASMTSSDLSHHASSASISHADEDDDESVIRVSKLKLPGAFAALATVTPSVEEKESEKEKEPEIEEPEFVSSTPTRDDVNDYDDKIKNVSKLEIPTVFGRQQSGEVDAHKHPTRSVSKLRIPTAFGGATDATPPPPEEEPPAPVIEEPVSNSPKSKLAAFAKSLAPTPEPTPVVEPEVPKRKKSTGKLKIPGVFGKAVGAAAPVPKKKPVTKLSAFLKTVDNEVPKPIEAKPERRFAFPIPGTEEAKKPMKPSVAKTAPKPTAPVKNAALAAFMTKVVAGPPKPAPRVERDVPDHHHVEEVKAVDKPAVVIPEPTRVVEQAAPAAPSPSKPSALAAFMQKVVVAPPTPAPRVERDEESPKDAEEPKKVVEETAPVEETKPVKVEEKAPAAPSPPKSNKLLAFLARVESPQPSASEEDEDETEEVEKAAESSTVAVEASAEEEEEEEGQDDEEGHEADVEDEAEEDDEEEEEQAEEQEEEEVDVEEPVESEAVEETVEEPVAVHAEPQADEEHVDEPAHVPAEPQAEEEHTEKPVHVSSEPQGEEQHAEGCVDDDDDEELVPHASAGDPDHHVIVEVTGELTHEAIARRSSLASPRKPSAVRKLFSDDEKSTAQESRSPVAVKSKVSSEESTNETLQKQLASVEAIVKTQNDELEALRAELSELRLQLQTQKDEAKVAQETAARREQEHEAELTALKSELTESQLALTKANEGAEAARYAAQMAFTARDEAEEASRILQSKLDELTRAA